MHFAYLTLELYLYRAVLRPLARSGPTGPQCVALDNSATQDDFAIDPDIRAGAEAVIDAAERCAEVVIEFVTNLNSSDFCGLMFRVTSWFCGHVEFRRATAHPGSDRSPRSQGSQACGQMEKGLTPTEPVS